MKPLRLPPDPARLGLADIAILVHPAVAVAWRAGAADLVSLRAGVRVGGGEVASRRAAPAAAARHPPEHSGARLSPRARARADVALPDSQRGARARGHPDDLHGAGVEPGALLLQLPQGAAAAAAGRVQSRGLAAWPDLSAARGARRGAGPRVERDAVDGGRLVLPHGERGVPFGRSRLPPSRHRVLHERRPRPGERAGDGARDRRHGGHDRVRGSAPVAAIGGVGREIPVGREQRRRAGPIVVGAGLPAARPPAAPRGRAAAARVSPGPPGGAAVRATVPRRRSRHSARPAVRLRASGGAEDRRRARDRGGRRRRRPGRLAFVAAARAAGVAGLGCAGLVRRAHVRAGDGGGDRVDRVGPARGGGDRPLPASRARAAARDSGRGVVPCTHAFSARDPAVPADRRRAGARRGRADGAGGPVVYPVQRDLRRGRGPRAVEGRCDGVSTAPSGALAVPVFAGRVPRTGHRVGDGRRGCVERLDRRGIHAGRRPAAGDQGLGKFDQRRHRPRQLPTARGGHRADEHDRRQLEPFGVALPHGLGADPLRTRDMTPGTVLLEAQHVTQRFRLPNGQNLEALRDVSLAVREHEVVALVGPSGCGKSTLLRLFAGLARPVDGKVLYRGQALYGVLGAAAMVFQSFALLPWLTVAENVAMGLEARGVDGPARRDAVARAINLVGLDGFEQAYPKELSGGMKQRVGFARALAVAPEILLMDEPFGALDPLTAENLRSQVVDLWRDPATGVNTLVIVTHSVEEAVFLAGRIVVFGSNPGHVREEMANPLPYPRQERSPEFEEMVDRLHAILTATLLPEPAPAAPQRLVPFPRVHVSEATGLLDHLLTRPDGKGPVFELAEDLGVDYDRMSAVVRAAEQIGWVTTPGEIVKLTAAGREVMAMDDAARKDVTRARLAKQPLFARLVAMLKEGEGTVEDEEVLGDLTIYFPFIPAESLFATVVEWGRYAELLDHDADAGRLTLLGWEGAAEARVE